MTLLCSPKVTQHHRRAGAGQSLEKKGSVAVPCERAPEVRLIAFFTIRRHMQPLNALQVPPA
jgi:hypothetical protein